MICYVLISYMYIHAVYVSISIDCFCFAANHVLIIGGCQVINLFWMFASLMCPDTDKAFI